MGNPRSRGALINYSLRKLGAPVLEINIEDDQIHDLVDDTLQWYYERHYEGIERMYLKYKITQDDIDRGTAKGTDGVGIVTTTGITTTTSNYYAEKQTSTSLCRYANIYIKYCTPNIYITHAN